MRLVPTSLRWRLLLLSLLVALPALLWLGWQLSHEFEASVEQRVHKELENHMNQLLARIRTLPDGRVKLKAPLSDPRFDTPLSGLYWQINADSAVLLRSRSLWDGELAISPALLRRGNVHEYTLKGPRGEPLYALVRGVWIDLPSPRQQRGNLSTPDSTAQDARDMRRYIFTVAIDHADISAAEAEFSRQLYLGLALLAGILVIMLVAQVIWGLRPVQALHQQLEDIRHGRRKDLAPAGIDELDPLIHELNGVLHSLEQKVEEARARAGNLAHGMKTPLAVLAALARDLHHRGLHQEAAEIDEQIRQLSRHIEHELARSKIHGGAASHHTPVARKLASIIRALQPMSPHLRWQMAVAEDATVPMEKGDFLELAGNLLENAAKWARTTVRVRLTHDEAGHPHLSVEDDGPGVPPQHYDTILQRGGRLDESVHGNGLGLAIVRDILDSYGYALRFFQAPLGGLGVDVIFHRQQQAQARSTVHRG